MCVCVCGVCVCGVCFMVCVCVCVCVMYVCVCLWYVCMCMCVVYVCVCLWCVSVCGVCVSLSVCGVFIGNTAVYLHQIFQVLTLAIKSICMHDSSLFLNPSLPPRSFPIYLLSPSQS